MAKIFHTVDESMDRSTMGVYVPISLAATPEEAATLARAYIKREDEEYEDVPEADIELPKPTRGYWRRVPVPPRLQRDYTWQLQPSDPGKGAVEAWEFDLTGY